MIIKCPPFLHNDTNATWFGTANYLLIFWDSLTSFKKRFGICLPVSGHMKVVLLDPYRTEDTELSATSNFKRFHLQAVNASLAIVCCVSDDIFYIAVCWFWGVCRMKNMLEFKILTLVVDKARLLSWALDACRICLFVCFAFSFITTKLNFVVVGQRSLRCQTGVCEKSWEKGFGGPEQETLAIKWYSWYSDLILPDFEHRNSAQSE